MSIIKVFSSFGKIYKIKIILAIIGTILVETGLYFEGGADWFIYIGSFIMVPFSMLIWNKSLYDKMQEERPFKMSFKVFDILSLVLVIIFFLSIIGLFVR